MTYRPKTCPATFFIVPFTITCQYYWTGELFTVSYWTTRKQCTKQETKRERMSGRIQWTVPCLFHWGLVANSSHLFSAGGGHSIDAWHRIALALVDFSPLFSSEQCLAIKLTVYGRCDLLRRQDLLSAGHTMPSPLSSAPTFHLPSTTNDFD